jgi:hypothetical protein
MLVSSHIQAEIQAQEKADFVEIVEYKLLAV